jgi:hypothetical protein
MSTLAPRVVVVSRPSELAELQARHGTRSAAAYFLRQRGQDLDAVVRRDEALTGALAAVGAAIPVDWRRGHVDRDDLPRFIFGPEDIVVVVGQDGLVANVAKYVDGQPVIGVDPEPDRNPGVLVRHPPQATARLLAETAADRCARELRTMAHAVLDDGQELRGLNEVYVGHVTHQSSRYLIAIPDGALERHSSSGVVVGTGTGSTGWCSSIARDRVGAPELPGPASPVLAWFVREAWPSPATGAALTSGLLDAGQRLEITAQADGLVAFADGIESDRLTLAYGQRITVGAAERRLCLVV